MLAIYLMFYWSDYISGIQNEQTSLELSGITYDLIHQGKKPERTLKWKLPLLLSVKRVIHRIVVYVNI